MSDPLTSILNEHTSTAVRRAPGATHLLLVAGAALSECTDVLDPVEESGMWDLDWPMADPAVWPTLVRADVKLATAWVASTLIALTNDATGLGTGIHDRHWTDVAAAG